MEKSTENHNKTVPVIAVCGRKNAGKTTLLERTIPHLTARGIRVGVLKHDAHIFQTDVPGTDTYRLHAAGANSVGIYSPTQFCIYNDVCRPEPEQIIALFCDLDLILLEGGKGTRYPKIEIVRADCAKEPMCQLDSLIALCTDLAPIEGIRCFKLEDYAGLAAFIISAAGL